MIQGKENIRAYFEKNAKKYFAVYYRGKESSGSPIFKNIRDDESESDITVQDAYASFEEQLNLLHAGEYTLIMNNKPKVSERGGGRVDFRISLSEILDNKSKDAVAGIGGVSAPAMDYEAMIAKSKQMALEEFQKLMVEKDLQDLKKKHEDLEKQLKEAQDKVNDPINKFIGALAPYSGGIISGFMGSPSAPGLTPGLAGFPQSSATPDATIHDNATAEEIINHTQKVFDDFFGAIQSAKPTEYLDIIVKLTTLIKTNPGKFETALSFL